MNIVSSLASIFKNNLYALSLYARQIAGTIVLFVIARYLSVYDYGIFSSYKAIASFILVLACLGYNEYILVSSKKNIHEVTLKVALFISNAFAIILISTFTSLFCSIELHLIFILVLLRTFFDTTFFSLALPYFQASNKFKTIAIINFIYSILVIFITLISYLFKLSLLKFLLLSCTIGLLNFIQCSFYIKVNYLNVFINIKRYLKLLDSSIWGYIGVTVAFLLYSQIPSLYVASYLTKEQAAIYFSAFTIANVISLLITAQNQKIIPEMINAPIDMVKSLIRKNFKQIMFINTIIFIGFCFWGKEILRLVYGQEYYQGGYYVLLIFTISNVNLALANIYGAYITASGQQHLKIKYQIHSIVISIVTLILVHKLNIYAAALSYLLSAGYIGFAYMLRTKKLIFEQLQQKHLTN